MLSQVEVDEWSKGLAARLLDLALQLYKEDPYSVGSYLYRRATLYLREGVGNIDKLPKLHEVIHVYQESPNTNAEYMQKLVDMVENLERVEQQTTMAMDVILQQVTLEDLFLKPFGDLHIWTRQHIRLCHDQEKANQVLTFLLSKGYEMPTTVLDSSTQSPGYTLLPTQPCNIPTFVPLSLGMILSTDCDILFAA
jgi:hypothetical protein